MDSGVAMDEGAMGWLTRGPPRKARSLDTLLVMEDVDRLMGDCWRTDNKKLINTYVYGDGQEGKGTTETL